MFKLGSSYLVSHGLFLPLGSQFLVPEITLICLLFLLWIINNEYDWLSIKNNHQHSQKIYDILVNKLELDCIDIANGIYSSMKIII